MNTYICDIYEQFVPGKAGSLKCKNGHIGHNQKLNLKGSGVMCAKSLSRETSSLKVHIETKQKDKAKSKTDTKDKEKSNSDTNSKSKQMPKTVGDLFESDEELEFEVFIQDEVDHKIEQK